MRKILTFFALVPLLISGCNSQSAEEAVQGYVSEAVNEFKDKLPRELKMVDSLIFDSAALKVKIEETTDLDSLKKYNDMLIDARNSLHGEILKIDSTGSKVKQLLELNQ